MTTTITRRSRLGARSTVLALLAAAVVVLTAGPASAHHPEISASARCAADGSYVIDYTSTAWFNSVPDGRGNADIRISVAVNGGAPVQVGAGAYVAPTFAFSGQFSVPASATSVVVTAYAAGNWDNGALGGQITSTPPVDLPTGCQPPGRQGCTPGYWKNHTASWAGTGYTPGQTAGSVFSIPASYGLAGKTLLQSLDGGGGTDTIGAAKILLRAGTAAVLNAGHGGVAYPQSSASIIAAVNSALAGGSRAAIITLAASLDADNNLGCPLN